MNRAQCLQSPLCADGLWFIIVALIALAGGTAGDLLLRRPPLGWANLGAFTALSGIGGAGLGEGQAGVTSKWFALRVDVAVNGLDVRETALIDARRLPARLVNRQWGEE